MISVENIGGMEMSTQREINSDPNNVSGIFIFSKASNVRDHIFILQKVKVTFKIIVR
jgi:predicted Abi (CAAX) family protease